MIPSLQKQPIIPPQINQLCQAIHLPKEVAMVHGKDHQQDSSDITNWFPKGNQFVDQAAEQTVSKEAPRQGLLSLAHCQLLLYLPLEADSHTCSAQKGFP